VKTVKNKYNAPIIEFLSEYEKSDMSRLHMPGHKGKAVSDIPDMLAGAYRFDITEITGADDLFAPKGIIKESEDNASKIFSAKTFYSVQGASLAIKAMLYLAYKHFEINHGPLKENDKPYMIVLGDCHKAFYHAIELLNIRAKKADVDPYRSDVFLLSENILKIVACEEKRPIGVYVTYPDYFGNIIDLKALKGELSKFDIPLLADGAHSAYFKFLNKGKYPQHLHPCECNVDICVTSAHKTLPVLTGGAYLHINDSFKDIFPIAKHSLDLFGSSSPSYLIMASLDAFNRASGDYEEKLALICERIDVLKKELREMGFNVHESDPLRIVVMKDDVYSGRDYADHLRKEKCEPECFDDDYVIMMLTPFNVSKDIERIKQAFMSIKNESEPLFDDIPGKEDNYDCLKNFS